MVLFRRRGWTAADYSAWSDRLLAEQVAFVAPSAWEGETVGWLGFMHRATTPETVRGILDAMK